MSTVDLVITNAQVVTCDGPPAASPTEQLGVISNGAVAVRAGRLAYVGPADDAPRDATQRIDAEGRVLMPGLVDPHTHLVFAGTRIDELARRLAGEDYRAIAATGGGIASTVRATRAASDEALYASARARAEALRTRGVTCVEVKSGYGLSVEHELRQLRVARRLDREGVVRTTTSLLGAHAVPPEHREDRQAYIDLVCGPLLERAMQEGLADSCDVYLDDGAFTRAEAERILGTAKRAGLGVRAHVGQFADLGGAELLASLGGLSADHLEQVSEEGLRAMAQAGVRAVLLPGAWSTLRQRPPDARRMRELGVGVAVGTDLNPGTSPTADLPLCGALAVRDAGLTMEEALLGMTREAAAAAGMTSAGRITAGAPADVALFDFEDPRCLVYALGSVRAALVVLSGSIVHDERPEGHQLW